MPRSRILGMQQTVDGVQRLAYLDRPEPVREDLLALAKPLAPAQAFRFAAPCAKSGCSHFDGVDCRLAKRIVQQLDAGVDEIPQCAIRDDCRWWNQEGAAACVRCPVISTHSDVASPQAEALRIAADPTSDVLDS